MSPVPPDVNVGDPREGDPDNYPQAVSPFLALPPYHHLHPLVPQAPLVWTPWAVGLGHSLGPVVEQPFSGAQQHQGVLTTEPHATATINNPYAQWPIGYQAEQNIHVRIFNHGAGMLTQRAPGTYLSEHTPEAARYPLDVASYAEAQQLGLAQMSVEQYDHGVDPSVLLKDPPSELDFNLPLGSFAPSDFSYEGPSFFDGNPLTPCPCPAFEPMTPSAMFPGDAMATTSCDVIEPARFTPGDAGRRSPGKSSATTSESAATTPQPSRKTVRTTRRSPAAQPAKTPEEIALHKEIVAFTVKKRKEKVCYQDIHDMIWAKFGIRKKLPTLRGQHRHFVKLPHERPRKPKWSKKDVSAPSRFSNIALTK